MVIVFLIGVTTFTVDLEVSPYASACIFNTDTEKLKSVLMTEVTNPIFVKVKDIWSVMFFKRTSI